MSDSLKDAAAKIDRCRQHVEELRIKLSQVQGELSRAIAEHQQALHALYEARGRQYHPNDSHGP